MKRIAILIIACMALAITTPKAHAEFRWGATAGVNVDHLKFKQDIVPSTSTVGYGAGILGEMNFPGIGFGLSFGLGYNQTGGKVDLGKRLIWSSLGYGNETVYLHNLHIPIHLRFKYTRLNGIENKIAPMVFVGPEFNIQVGHGKCEAFKYSGGDLGLAVGLGAELYKRWQITGQYTIGMTYALKTRLLQDFSAKCSTWAVRATYFF